MVTIAFSGHIYHSLFLQCNTNILGGHHQNKRMYFLSRENLRICSHDLEVLSDCFYTNYLG
jgi:hypothetical protein